MYPARCGMWGISLSSFCFCESRRTEISSGLVDPSHCFLSNMLTQKVPDLIVSFRPLFITTLLLIRPPKNNFFIDIAQAPISVCIEKAGRAPFH